MICIALGVILSVGVIYFDMGEPISWEIVFLVFSSMGLGLIDKRFTCLAYTVALVYLFDALLVLLSIKSNYFTLPYEKLVLLVGILHVVEGILTYLFGDKGNRCIITYKGNQIAGGYEAYRRWNIPLLLFSINGIYIPILCVLVYGDETCTMPPKEKARRMGKDIIIYGLFIFLIGYFTYYKGFPIALGIIMMPNFHDLLFQINKLQENRKVIYGLPIKGVRVIEIKNEQKKKDKICRGDIILSINGNEIDDEESYEKQVLEAKLDIVLENLTGEKKVISFDQVEYQKLEVIILPKE